MKRNIDLKQLAQQAGRVLQNNDLGTSTKPAPSLYPHQWNWDSAFIALGLSHTNQKRAQEEIKSLLLGQWSTGMVPHIVFNSEAKNYHPGPEYWGTETAEAPQSIQTSGITQPPVIALASLEIYRNAEYKSLALEFLREVYPSLLREEVFLSTARDPFGEGLSFICHPWESGMDNSAIWDKPLHRFKMDFEPNFIRKDNQSIPAGQRPTDSDYTRYSYLVQRYAMEGWDQTIIYHLQHFVVQSLLFSTLHMKSRQSLAAIARIIGEDSSSFEVKVQQSLNSFRQKLWDKDSGQYLDYDMNSKSHIYTDNLSQFLPLFAGIPTPAQADRMISKLLSQAYCPEGAYGICTQSRYSPEYNEECYWRGPVWINMNWMIIRGLELYGYTGEARALAHQTLSLILDHGFFEYFNPETGQGLGSDSFSWTAALVLDLIASGYE